MILQIVRGTSATLNITLQDPDGNAYILADGEILRFGIKRNSAEQKCCVEKELTAADLANGVYPVRLTPEDTLGLAVGGYCYDAGVQSGEDYYMVIPCSHLEITKNITQKAVATDG